MQVLYGGSHAVKNSCMESWTHMQLIYIE